MTLDIRSAKQLFVDDALIECMEGVDRHVNRPQKYAGNPVMVGQSPWEEKIYPMGTVLFEPDERIFKAWYHAKTDQGCHICYATSGDGVSWQKPRLGVSQYKSSKENNILSYGQCVGDSCCPCVTGLAGDADPGRRYMMYVWLWSTFPEGGMRRAYSADGVQWRVVPGAPLLTYGKYTSGNSANDVVYGYLDHTARQHVMYYVVLLPNWPGCAGRVEHDFHPDWKRVMARRTSPDGLAWSDTKVVLMPDAQDPVDLQFYNMSVYEYEGIYLGAVSAYHVREQTMDVQLVFSRDGENWVRVGDREPFIELGPEGSFDSCMITTSSHLVRVDDELWVYYVGSDTLHNEPWHMGIGLARLRLDGFASLDAGPRGGSIMTKAFSFTGKRLVVNADAQGGTMVAQIVDERQNAIDGFSKEACDPMRMDAVHQIVRWKGNDDLSALEGKTIRVKFHMTNARLYAFKVVT